jgi:outer membrane receptor protein involved in Fe transport
MPLTNSQKKVGAGGTAPQQGGTMKNYQLIWLLLGLFPASSVHSAGDEVEKLLPLSLEELLEIQVTISTNTLQKLSKAPSVVSVITAEDIKATGTTNIVEILESLPGVHIRNNLFGFRPQVTMRGANSTNTLLMVNGAPIKDLAWSNGIFWKGLPANMVERVEVIRGPGSALFGSDASSGVINIITKTAGKISQAEAGVRAGSFDTQEAWVQHGAQWNGFDIALTADVMHTDGHRPFYGADAQTARGDVSYAPGHADTGWDNQDIRFSIGLDNWRLLADYTRHSNLDTGLTGAGVLDPQTSASDRQASLALLYNNASLAKDWGLNAEVRYRDLEYSSGDGFQERPPGYRSTVSNPATTYPDGQLNQQRSAERRMNFELSGVYSGVEDHAMRIGGGYVWQDLYDVDHRVNYGRISATTTLPAGGPLVDISNSAYAFAPEKSRSTRYLFVQDIWGFAENWELTAGARYDDYSDFGSTTNPRLALVWQTTDRLTSKLMYGEAFREPSFLELYARTSATTPNPDLKPEESKTWDLSFSWLAARDLTLGFDLFHFAQSNMVTLDSAGMYQNAGDHVIRGVEMEAQWQATESLRFSGNFTQRKQDYSSLSQYGIPDEEAYLRADWTFLPKWHWNLQANWAGKRELRSNDTRHALDAYTLADTTVRYQHDKQWEFAASIRNLFDVDAEEYTSSRSLLNYLPLPGRNFFAEIRYKF